MLRTFIFIVFMSSFCIAARAEKVDSLLIELEQRLQQREAKTNEKLQLIEQIHQQRANVGDNKPVFFETTFKLYKEYESFKFDSAYKYAMELNQLVDTSSSFDQKFKAKLAIGKVYLLKGMFKEAIDILDTVNTQNLTFDQKVNYFTIMSRLYFDIRDYVQDTYFTPIYHQKALSYCDSIINISEKDSKLYAKYNGFKNLAEHDWIVARAYFLELERKYTLNEHEKAVVFSCLGGIYSAMDDAQSGRDYFIKAAIADLNATVKETTALRYLAMYYFRNNNIDEAQRYIKIAKENADFFGSNFRKLQVSMYLPIIEAEMQNQLKAQRSIFMYYAIAVSVLTVIVVVFLLVLIRQIGKHKKSKQLISETFDELKKSQKIKEKYIGYYFNISLHFINRLEDLKTNITNQIIQNKPNGWKQIVNSINVNDEREVIYTDFDKMFLQLFPNFIEEFNKLFIGEKCPAIKENQLLSIEHRIFALIRLGILNTSKIAEILHVSKNTVYTYKAKVKKQSFIDNEEFEVKIRQI